ncbi:MAG: adenylate kinase [Dehalococcoidia bacterium]
MNVILIGPPGSGKGTQANKLASSLNVPSVSSGDLFREHKQSGSELGNKAAEYMSKGELVPDEITVNMVIDWIESKKQAGGFLLDGFPRTLSQAKSLDTYIKPKSSIDIVLYIKVRTKELVNRLAGRFFCTSCGTSYHIEFAPPKLANVCDHCESKLMQRDDDKPNIVMKRIHVYESETSPLINYYQKQSILKEIDGEESIDIVSQNLQTATIRKPIH